MHMLIRALVSAESKEAALRTAKATVFDRLVADDVFDYSKTFDHEKGKHKVSGADRWGHDIPAAAPADTEAGEELIEEGMEATEREFRRNLAAVKLAFEHLSDEEIREMPAVGSEVDLRDRLGDEEIDAVAEEHSVDHVSGVSDPRHAMYRIGAYRGPSVWVYDGTDWSCGDGVRTRTKLQTIRERAGDVDSDLWVVPADVHY